MKLKLGGVVSGVSLFALTVSTGSAIAEGQSEGKKSIEEIIVTAQKTAESAQEVPRVVESIAPEKLDSAGVTQLQDLSHATVSIQGTASTQFAPPAIRGITSFGYSIGVQSQTGVVLDDIPQPSFSTIANELADVQRIEVLPGPQSTLSGRNASGGLIYITTVEPSFRWRGNFTAEATNDEQKRLSGYVTGPVSDTVAFSLSGFKDEWDGVIRNLGEGNLRESGFDQKGGRGKLMIEPTDNLSITLTAFYAENDMILPTAVGGAPYVKADPNAGLFQLGGVPYPVLFPQVEIKAYNTDVQATSHSTALNMNKGASLRFDYESDIGTLSSITNYSFGKQPQVQRLFPVDSIVSRGRTFSLTDYTITQDIQVDYYYQEFRIVSPDTFDNLRYLGGLLYSDTRNNQTKRLFFPLQPGVSYDHDIDGNIKQVAAYSQVTYDIVEDTTVVGGLRVENDKNDYRWQFFNPVNGAFISSSSGNDSDTFVTWDASVRHMFTPDINGYITYANEQTGRVYDLSNSTGAAKGELEPVDSQKVQSIEMGIKSFWLNQRLALNLGLFYSEYDHYQVSSTQVINGLAEKRLYAVGEVKDKGAEVQLNYLITPKLQWGFDIMYLDAKIRWPNAPCYVGQTAAQGCVGGLQTSVIDIRLPNTSKYRLISTLDYTTPLSFAPLDFTMGASYRYQTEEEKSNTGDPLLSQGSYGILNLNAGLKYDNGDAGNYGIQFFVNNVFDKHTYQSLFRDPSSNGFAMQATYPRDFGRYAGVRVTGGF